MQILGIIVIVVGVALFVVGKNMHRQLPPNYEEEDDGFLQLLLSVGKMVSGAGIVFVVIGLIFIILGVVG